MVVSVVEEGLAWRTGCALHASTPPAGPGARHVSGSSTQTQVRRLCPMTGMRRARFLAENALLCLVTFAGMARSSVSLHMDLKEIPRRSLQ